MTGRGLAGEAKPGRSGAGRSRGLPQLCARGDADGCGELWRGTPWCCLGCTEKGCGLLCPPQVFPDVCVRPWPREPLARRGVGVRVRGWPGGCAPQKCPGSRVGAETPVYTVCAVCPCAGKRCPSCTRVCTVRPWVYGGVCVCLTPLRVLVCRMRPSWPAVLHCRAVKSLFTSSGGRCPSAAARSPSLLLPDRVCLSLPRHI